MAQGQGMEHDVSTCNIVKKTYINEIFIHSQRHMLRFNNKLHVFKFPLIVNELDDQIY